MKTRETLFATAALILLAACGNNDIPEAQNPDGTLIRYAVASVSRAPIETVADLKNFDVWAFKDNTQQFQTGVTNQNGAWTPATTQYWHPGTYDFYALSGHAADAVTPSADGAFTVTVANSETDSDLLTASNTGIVYASGEAEPVNFDFKHEKACITITVKADSKLEETLNVTAVTLEGIYKGGVLTRNFKAADATARVWSFAGYDQQTVQGTTQSLRDGGSYQPVSNLLLPVQELDSSVKLTIAYTVNRDSETKTFELKDYSHRWANGNKYNYSFTVHPDGIIFSGFTVAEWGVSHSGGDINVQ